MKKYLVAGLLALGAPALLVTPAGAAVPKAKPQQTITCDGFGNTAKLWYTKKNNTVTRLAVDASTCAQWVGVVIGDGETGASLVGVAPNAYFNRHVSIPNPPESVPVLRMIESTKICDGWWTSVFVVWPHHHGRLESPSNVRWCDDV